MSEYTDYQSLRAVEVVGFEPATPCLQSMSMNSSNMFSVRNLLVNVQRRYNPIRRGNQEKI